MPHLNTCLKRMSTVENMPSRICFTQIYSTVYWLSWILALGDAASVIEMSNVMVNTNLAACGGMIAAMIMVQIMYKLMSRWLLTVLWLDWFQLLPVLQPLRWVSRSWLVRLVVSGFMKRTKCLVAIPVKSVRKPIPFLNGSAKITQQNIDLTGEGGHLIAVSETDLYRQILLILPLSFSSPQQEENKMKNHRTK